MRQVETMTLYLKITKDKYELPLAVAGSMRELSRMCRITESAVSHAMHETQRRGGRCQYIKVEVDDNN